MGVMACDRSYCEHIMCDRLILGSSIHICDSCWQELLEFRKTWPDTMTTADVEDRIRKYMNTPVGSHRTLDAEGIEAEFRRLTGQANE
jgi:hypothetical protein